MNGINEIKKKDVRAEIERIKVVLSKKPRIGRESREALVDSGYVRICIGTSKKKSLIKSKEVVVKELFNKFIQGRFLCVGVANKERYNYAYVKEVV